MTNLIQEATDKNTSGIRLEELAHTSIELARLVATNLAAPPEGNGEWGIGNG